MEVSEFSLFISVSLRINIWSIHAFFPDRADACEFKNLYNSFHSLKYGVGEINLSDIN